MKTSDETAPSADIHRPRYHFLPAANWMNDPNGVIQWDGRYHLFFQYNPDGAYHANVHWGHAVSDDLVRWRELPIAIAPTPDSPDQGGIFSGCMVNDGGTPTAIYTGVNDDYTVQTQCLATGNHDLTQWTKHPRNPVIGCAPDHLGQTHDFRDPYVWRAGDSWYLTVSSHIVGVGGAVLLYRSANLVDWQYLHPLYVGEKARSGRNFECANFFPLGDKWMLIVSAQLDHAPSTTLFWVGRFEHERFVPEHEGIYDAGYSYASLVHQDDANRWLIYSWIREGRSKGEQLAAGWTGVQAIPRVLSLDSANRLISQPAPAVESLRGPRQRFSASDLRDAALEIDDLSLDIEAAMDANAAAQCGMELACGGDKLALVYERNTRTLQVRRQYQRDEPAIDSQTQGIVHALDPGENLELRLLLDGSVLEVIANGRTRLTSRFYPAGAADACLRVISPASVKVLDIWQMSSIW